MRVHIGGDHAAYDLKCTLVTFLQAKGYDVVDHGPDYFDPEDDYPVAVLRAAEAAREIAELCLNLHSALVHGRIAEMEAP